MEESVEEDANIYSELQQHYWWQCLFYGLDNDLHTGLIFTDRINMIAKRPKFFVIPTRQ